MAIQAFADEMKGRVELMGRQTQDVAKTYLDINRQAYGVLFGNAQTLARAELENGRKFYNAAFERFAAARTAGMHELALLPVAMAPEGRDTLIAAYREACNHVVKTRSELFGVLREGFRDIRGAWIGERVDTGTAAGTTADKAKTAAVKAPTAVRATARKSPTAARRKTPTAKRAAGTAPSPKGKGSARVKSADSDAGETRPAGAKS